MDIEAIKKEGLEPNFEQIKEKGTLALAPEDAYRLRTYGFCPQKHPGYFILRIRIPGGKVTTRQLATLAEIVETHGRGLAHLTVRQGLEMRFVRIEEAEEIFKKLESAGLSSRSTDGHTIRNVMACPHGATSPHGLFDIGPWARMISDYFVKQADLINTLLPNRLNIFFSACLECNAYAFIHDIAFVAITRKNEESQRGAELWVGGSMGSSPRRGFKIKDFIPLSDMLSACCAVIAVYVRHGKTRLKYMMEPLGQERFRALFDKAFEEERALRKTMPMPSSDEQPSLLVQRFEEILSRFLSRPPGDILPQRQKGYAALKMAVPLGEIRSTTLVAIGSLAKQYGAGMIYFTNNQDIEIPWIPIRKISRLIKALAAISLFQKGNGCNTLACSGIEFCSLAKTHAQGTARELFKVLKPDSSNKASFLQALSVHISGCQNGCARHYLGDIGLAGEMEEEDSAASYRLYLGGGMNKEGDVGRLVRRGIPENQIVPVINALVTLLLEDRQEGETFHDVVSRIPLETVSAQLATKIQALQPQDEDLVMTPYIMETT